MSQPASDLSPAQMEVMEIVWAQGEVSAREVRAELSQTRPIARNTVRTMLERMEAKGWLRHREQDRTYLYSAARPREATIGAKVRDIVDSVCGGSAEALVSALLDYRGLSDGELSRIRQLLDEAEDEKAKPKRGRS